MTNAHWLKMAAGLETVERVNKTYFFLLLKVEWFWNL